MDVNEPLTHAAVEKEYNTLPDCKFCGRPPAMGVYDNLAWCANPKCVIHNLDYTKQQWIKLNQ